MLHSGVIQLDAIRWKESVVPMRQKLSWEGHFLTLGLTAAFLHPLCHIVYEHHIKMPGPVYFDLGLVLQYQLT